MKAREVIQAGLNLLIIIGLLSLMGCSKNSITGPEPPMLSVPLSKGIPADQMTWVSWKPEVIEKITALAKGSQTKTITARSGGKVGGENTYGNKVEFPPEAMMEDQRITVEVVCIEGNDQCGAEVDFLPGQQFLTDVKVTLSWEYLDVDENDYEGLDFHVYLSEDGGETWNPVEIAEVDYEKQTISVYMDHFTRYAWGL